MVTGYLLRGQGQLLYISVNRLSWFGFQKWQSNVASANMHPMLDEISCMNHLKPDSGLFYYIRT